MTAAPRLETERLVLRALEDADAPLLLQNFQDPIASRYWFTPDRSIEEALARVTKAAQAWRENGFGDWAVVEKSSGRFLGFCGLHDISGMSEVNVGYLLGSPFWGRGYGTEACRRAIRFGFDEARLPLIVGVTHPDNAPSIKVLTKCGMTYWKTIERGGVPRVVYSIAGS